MEGLHMNNQFLIDYVDKNLPNTLLYNYLFHYKHRNLKHKLKYLLDFSYLKDTVRMFHHLIKPH